MPKTHDKTGAGNVRAREFSLGDEDFSALRELVRKHTGISLSDQKRELVYGRLSRRLRALGLGSFREYRRMLEEDEADELVNFCNAVTTNLTSFFREAHHFEYLRTWVLKERAGPERSSRRLRFWSAGCSSGEEPYSLAMTLRESTDDCVSWDTKILATDLDTEMLGKATHGTYAGERIRGVSPQRISRFFKRPSQSPHLYSVTDDLRALVVFRQLNLMHALPMKGPLDAVFCRNVIIYFDKETQRRLFERIARLQPSGALLFLGHSESLFKVSDAYSLVGKTIYRRN
jgi:chemotaxis protein methyltransferase CheR